jgi:hypothetical protein
MADDTTTVVIVVLVFVMIAVVWLELRYLRRKSTGRRQRAERRPEELQDEAHNSLITTRAIASTLAERGGIRSDEVDSLLREAQMAYNRRNYRVAIDLTAKAKDRLAALRKEHAAQGDMAKVAAPPPPASEDEEPTTKEILQKEYAPNLIQSKFAIALAESTIVEGQTAGRDIVQAQSLVVSAKARFEAKDYSGALTIARQAEKSARGESVTVSVAPASIASAMPNSPAVSSAAKPAPAAVALGSACPSCGAPMKAEDTFCRKCGTRVVQTHCPNCRTDLLPDDAFCRKCGTRIAH